MPRVITNLVNMHAMLFVLLPTLATSIRVATYNMDCRVCDLSHEHGASFKARTEREREVLSEINADVIFLEEPLLPKDAPMVLPRNRNWTVLYDNRTLIRDPDATLAVDSDKFDVLDWGFIWLGPHPQHPGSFDIFTLPRLATWARLREVASP